MFDLANKGQDLKMFFFNVLYIAVIAIREFGNKVKTSNVIVYIDTFLT